MHTRTSKTSHRWIVYTIALCLCLFTAACSHTPPPQPAACIPPSGTDLAAAFAQARDDLGNGGCSVAFEAYFNSLLSIAQGDPRPENRKRFSDFLVWANEAGILTHVQSKEYFNRYFHHTFVSLPDDYSICARSKDKEKIFREMEDELRLKELGLVKACADKDTYATAYNQFNTLNVVLEATCLACEEE